MKEISNRNRLLAIFLVVAMHALVACGDDDESASVNTILPDGYENVSAGRFSPDSSRIAMIGTPEGSDDDHLIVTNLEGGDVEVIVTEGLDYLSTIAWMPDGDSVVYGGDGGILEVVLDGSQPTVLVEDFAVACVDVTSDGGSAVWSTNGGSSVQSADLSDESADQIVAGPNGSMPRFSPDGSRIGYVTSDGFGVGAPDGSNQTEIEASVDYLSNVAWRDANTLGGLTSYGVETYDVGSGESTKIHEQFAAMNLDISPDGAMFLYGVNGRQTLYIGRF